MRYLIAAITMINIFVTATPVIAQYDIPAHTIRVKADSEIKAIPDKAVIILGVQFQDSIMSVAKLKSENLTLKAIELARKYAVQDSDISTEYYNVEPQYKNYDRFDFLGYRVNRRIVINLNNISNFESLMNDLLANGIENIKSVQFKIKDQNKYTEQAISAALKSAKARAELIAREMGLTLGNTYSIDESYSSIRPPIFGSVSNEYMNSRNMMMDLPPGQEQSTTFGYLNVSANVTVSFEFLEKH